MNKDINIHVMDFKTTKVREMVTENEDGSFTVFINARLSAEGQLRAYQHALEHIRQDDFQKKNVQNIEYDAHSKVE